MTEYLSREQILKSEIKAEPASAFDGQVLVSEMPADLINDFLADGIIEAETVNGEEVISINYERLNFVKVAQRVIVDEDGNALLEEQDLRILKRKSFGDIQNVVQKSFDITDWGEEAEPKKE